jgi:hypothetical protein
MQFSILFALIPDNIFVPHSMVSDLSVSLRKVAAGTENKQHSSCTGYEWKHPFIKIVFDFLFMLGPLLSLIDYAAFF